MFGAEILVSLATALGMSYSNYISKMKVKESFDVKKFGRTMIVGLVLGTSAYFSGMTITAENWEMYLAGNAGLVTIADILTKFSWKLITGKNK